MVDLDQERGGFEQWAIVEVMGHRRFAGFVTEAQIAGQGFVRVDVPAIGDQQAFTKMIGPGSVYAITPVTEETAKAAAAAYRSEPVSSWELRSPVAMIDSPVDDDDDEDRPF